jgi:hypothetical protein
MALTRADTPGRRKNPTRPTCPRTSALRITHFSDKRDRCCRDPSESESLRRVEVINQPLPTEGATAGRLLGLEVPSVGLLPWASRRGESLNRRQLRQNSAMAAEPNPARGDSKKPEGLSAFIARVLDQLAITAWLPAALLIGVATLLVQLSQHPENGLDIPAAVQRLATLPWGTIIVLIFGLVLTTMVTQAFSFGAIRTLEGYWGPSGFGGWAGGKRIARQLLKRKSLDERIKALELKAFHVAKPKLIGRIPREQLDVIEERVYRIPAERRTVVTAEVRRAATKVKWRAEAEPSTVAALDRAYSRLADYPSQLHRFLPTKMGNIIRASEDQLGVEGKSLEGFLMRNYSAIPTRLLAQHDQWRDRLEMYSTLVYVSLSLALGSLPLLRSIGPYGRGSAVACVTLGLLTWLFHRAALASARGYGSVLVNMNAYVQKARSEAQVTSTGAEEAPSPTPTAS